MTKSVFIYTYYVVAFQWVGVLLIIHPNEYEYYLDFLQYNSR